jgi:hypothetical protein
MAAPIRYNPIRSSFLRPRMELADYAVIGNLWGAMKRLRLSHSQHWRLLQHVTVQSITMIIMVHLGRWRCRHAGCERRIFTNRL